MAVLPQRREPVGGVRRGLRLTARIALGFCAAVLFAQAEPLGTTPNLPQPESLAGEWILVSGERSCRLHLTTERLGAVNALAFEEDEGCASRLLASPIVGWRPARDGLALVSPRGTTALFLSGGPGGPYRSRRSLNPFVELRRA